MTSQCVFNFLDPAQMAEMEYISGKCLAQVSISTSSKVISLMDKAAKVPRYFSSLGAVSDMTGKTKLVEICEC